MTKSKFNGDTIFWFFFSILWLIIGAIFIFRALKRYSFKINETLILLLFIILFYLLINFIKQIKTINIIDNKLKYYSIFKPLGKTLDLKKHHGKIILTEFGTRGRYKVIYLVNNQNKTSFKIMGVHYKNFDELNNALSLKIVKYPSGLTNYFKLLFFEKVFINSNKKK